MADSKNNNAIKPLETGLTANLHDRKLTLTVSRELNDAGFAAHFGPIQEALETKVMGGQGFDSCILNFEACEWADPLPLLSLGLIVEQFVRSGGGLNVLLPHEECEEVNCRRLLKYMAREGFITMLQGRSVQSLCASEGKTGHSQRRLVTILGEPVTEERIQSLKDLNVDLAFERSTCLPATILHLDHSDIESNSGPLDAANTWAESAYFSSIDPVITDMVPSWAQGGLRYRMLMAIKETLHNVVEHAYQDSGFAAIYVRYREGALGESPSLWNRLKNYLPRERDNRRVPLLHSRLGHANEQFPLNRAGFFELFVIDSGMGLCTSLKDVIPVNEVNPLHQLMLRIFDDGLGRRSSRPTQYGGIYLIRQLLEPTRDYLRILDNDTWWGTELPLKRTASGSTLAGNFSLRARGREYTGLSVHGVAWTLRLSWLDRSDKAWEKGVWVGLFEGAKKEVRNSLFQIFRLPDERSPCAKSLRIVDQRFTIVEAPQSLSEYGLCTCILILPRQDLMKNQIQAQLAQLTRTCELQPHGQVVIGDIPSEEAYTYVTAIEASVAFRAEPLTNISRLVLVTRDLRVCVMVRGDSGVLTANKQSAHEFVRTPRSGTLVPVHSLADYYQTIRAHDSKRLWNLIDSEKGAFIDETVKWSSEISLNGYLDFPQSLTHPICRAIYGITLQRLTGLFPRVECRLSGLDGLVDSLVARFNAQQHPRTNRNGPQGLALLQIGSVQVSGITESIAGQEDATVFHFFRHPSGTGHGRYLLEWLGPTAVKPLHSTRPYVRIGRTPVVARNGWKSYRLPRFDSDGKSIYEQTPRETYRAWQEPGRNPMKVGHWKYGGHHDFLTLNLLAAFDTEIDHISLAFAGGMARYVYRNFLIVFGLEGKHLNERGRALLEAMKGDKARKVLPAEVASHDPIILYPSHPVTDHIFDRFLGLLDASSGQGVDKTSILERTRQRLVPVLPIRRNRSGSGLLLSGVVLEKLQAMNPKPPVIIFDDALISGRTYADLKRILASLGVTKTFSIVLLDRQRFASADHVNAENHFCFWRLDAPTIGTEHNCPLCNARGRVNDLADEIKNVDHLERLSSWREIWKAVSPTSHWGDSGLRPIPLNLSRPERKFGIEYDEHEGVYNQIGGPTQQVRITNSAGLIAFVSELHSMTSHDDLALRTLQREHLPPEARIQLLASQLLLFAGEFDRDLSRELGEHLLAALWDAETSDRHTALACLVLVGCGDEFLRDVVGGFFADEVRQRDAVDKNFDLVLLLVLTLLVDRMSKNGRKNLHWLHVLSARKGLLPPRNTLEVYEWLHRVANDESGKAHSTALYRFLARDPQADPALHNMRAILQAITHIEATIPKVEPFWLRDRSDDTLDLSKLQETILDHCKHLKIAIKEAFGGHGRVSAQSAQEATAHSLTKELLEKIARVHAGVFFGLDLKGMKNENPKAPKLLEELTTLTQDSVNGGKSIRWHQPSPEEIAGFQGNIGKPEMVEVYILWSAQIVDAVQAVLTNAKHASGEIMNPWRSTETERSHVWGRVRLLQNVAVIELQNQIDNAHEASKHFSQRSTQSKVFFNGLGCRCTCEALDSKTVITRIEIPYAHTLGSDSKE